MAARKILVDDNRVRVAQCDATVRQRPHIFSDSFGILMAFHFHLQNYRIETSFKGGEQIVEKVKKWLDVNELPPKIYKTNFIILKSLQHCIL